MRKRERRRLKQSPYDQQRAPKEDRTPTTKRIAGEDREDRTEDASQSVGRHDLALDLRVRIVEDFLEGWVGQQAAEDALVVAWWCVSL